MWRRSFVTALLLLSVLSIPSVASANAGTPLIWLRLSHLFIGNAVIGILEGLLLSWMFRVRCLPSVGLMILANYFSSWVGFIWLIESIQSHLQFDLSNAWTLIRKLAGVTYLLTLLLEWPFVALAFWRNPHWVQRRIV